MHKCIDGNLFGLLGERIVSECLGGVFACAGNTALCCGHNTVGCVNRFSFGVVTVFASTSGGHGAVVVSPHVGRIIPAVNIIRRDILNVLGLLLKGGICEGRRVGRGALDGAVCRRLFSGSDAVAERDGFGFGMIAVFTGAGRRAGLAVVCPLIGRFVPVVRAVGVVAQIVKKVFGVAVGIVLFADGAVPVLNSAVLGTLRRRYCRHKTESVRTVGVVIDACDHGLFVRCAQLVAAGAAPIFNRARFGALG